MVSEVFTDVIFARLGPKFQNDCQPKRRWDDLGQMGRKEFGHTESTDAVSTENLKRMEKC